MNKVVIGVVLGAILGLLDGLSSWFTPAVRPYLASILIGSTAKGIIAGLAIGFFARKASSMRTVLVFGTLVGLFLAFLVAAMPSATGEHYWLEIMLPGSLVGLIVGYATQRYGRSATAEAA